MIDVADFCRLKERAEGEVAVADLSRLVHECADNSGQLKWLLQGGFNQFGHQQLLISVAGSLQLRCQRCLAPFAQEIATQSVLVLAPDEESADAIEELLADDAIDVVVVPKQLDILQLVEDDALLALPFAPKHEICPDQGEEKSRQGMEKPSAFSVLKQLKQ